MLNLVIAMCRGEGTVPTLFKDLGYTDSWVELEFPTSAGRYVKPEIIVCSEKQAHTIMWEWKAGGNLSQEQLSRYASVTGDDLLKNAQVPAAASKLHDVSVVVPAEKGDDCKRKLSEWKMAFPLLTMDEEHQRLMIAANSFRVDELDQGLRQGLQVDLTAQPLRYVPLEPDSPLWRFIEFAGQHVVTSMVRNQPSIRLGSLESTVVPAWSVLAPSEQKQYRRKIKQAVTELAQNELSDYLRPGSEKQITGEPTWDVTNSPSKMPTDKRTVALKTLNRQVATAVARKGGPITAAHLFDGQMTLPISPDE